MRVLLIAFLAAGLTACTTAESASEAQTVKITPLGSHAGAFCAFDRAMIFEDPDATRLLYDVGRPVRGAEHARLGSIAAVLLCPVHCAHPGDRHHARPDHRPCATPAAPVRHPPSSRTVNAPAATTANLLVGGAQG